MMEIEMEMGQQDGQSVALGWLLGGNTKHTKHMTQKKKREREKRKGTTSNEGA